MELLKRYLYQVEKNLPLGDRKDTIKELESSILDQLDAAVENGENKNTALNRIITEMGDPLTVGTGYKNDAPLISKESEYLLFLVMKVLGITLPIIFIILNTISLITSENNYNIVQLLFHLLLTIPSIIGILLQVFAILFIVFIAIEKYLKPEIIEEMRKESEKFDPKNLPMIQNKIYKVSIVDEIFSICGCIVFLYIINFEQGLISIMIEGIKTPILNNNFNRILPLFNMSLIATIIVASIHLIIGKKTVLTKTLEFALILISTLILFILSISIIFNTSFIDAYNLYLPLKIFRISMFVAAIITLISGMVEFLKIFFITNKTK